MKWWCRVCGFNGGISGGIEILQDEFPVHCICGDIETYDEFLLRPYKLSSVTLKKLRFLVKGCKSCEDKLWEKVSMNNDKLLKEVQSGTGPGSQLWRLFSRLGIQHRPDCSCLLLADVMNELGPQGCRDYRDKLLKLMRKNQKKYGWYDYLKAGTNMIVLGWIFKLNPLDPLPNLLDEAIRLAEQAQCQSSGNTASQPSQSA